VSMTSDQISAAVLQLYDAFARRDLPAGLACMTDDIQWHEADGLPWGGLRVGPEAVTEGVFAPSLALIPDLAVTPEHVVTSGDTVIVMHRYTGTVAATGAKLDLAGIGVWDVRDGRISRYWQFVDTVLFREALGDATSSSNASAAAAGPPAAS
jgi:ketosteroid isomerase-like protein